MPLTAELDEEVLNSRLLVDHGMSSLKVTCPSCGKREDEFAFQQYTIPAMNPSDPESSYSKPDLSVWVCPHCGVLFSPQTKQPTE